MLNSIKDISSYNGFKLHPSISWIELAKFRTSLSSFCSTIKSKVSNVSSSGLNGNAKKYIV